MMVDVADPGTAHAVWCERNVILDPDSLIFEREYAAQAARKVPGEGIDPATLLYILYDDRQVSLRLQERLFQKLRLENSVIRLYYAT